jgi:hypothetical protein
MKNKNCSSDCGAYFSAWAQTSDSSNDWCITWPVDKFWNIEEPVNRPSTGPYPLESSCKSSIEDT